MHDIVRELHHSVKLHILINGGPSNQLAVFLLKVIDFIGDPPENNKSEIINLSFIIVEALAILIQQSIDSKALELKNSGINVDRLIEVSGNILIVLGRSKKINDKIAAKNAVLKSMAAAFAELKLYTNSEYPRLYYSDGTIL